MILSFIAALLVGPPAPKYPADAIAPALRENAHAVVRAYDEVVTVKSASQLTKTVHKVVTILDPAGSDTYGELVVSYDALNRITQARWIASCAGAPSRCSTSATSIIMIAFFLTMPISISTPMSAMIDRSKP